jgi:hypothetical protein
MKRWEEEGRGGKRIRGGRGREKGSQRSVEEVEDGSTDKRGKKDTHAK